MPDSSEQQRYVTLRAGLALPIEPVQLVLDLEARGFTLTRDGDFILIRPVAQLTEADRAAIKQWRGHVLAIIDNVEAIQ